MALVVQKRATRLGNANPYISTSSAATQYGSSGPAVFHDVTTGNNGVPGVVGFAAGPATIW